MTKSELKLNNLEEALKIIIGFKGNEKDLSIKPTKIILPPNIIKMLKELGYDTQEKIDYLIKSLLEEN